MDAETKKLCESYKEHVDLTHTMKECEDTGEQYIKLSNHKEYIKLQLKDALADAISARDDLTYNELQAVLCYKPSHEQKSV